VEGYLRGCRYTVYTAGVPSDSTAVNESYFLYAATTYCDNDWDK
jgi:hypothetical protein